MLQVKIQGETPKSGATLCSTCKQAVTVTGQECQNHVVCSAGIFAAYKGRVPFRVAECTAYHPSNMPWLHEMEQMAWIVEARKRGPAGFQQPEEGMEVIITKPRNLGGDMPASPTQPPK